MDTVIFNINTRKIEKKSTSNFIFNFDKVKNVVQVKILSIELPKTIYYFTDKRDNNTFTIVVNSIEYRFILPEGNYTIEALISEIFEFLDTVIGAVFTYNYESNVKLLTISSNVPFSIYFKNTTDYTQLGKLLGFDLDEYENVIAIQNNSKILIDTDRYFLLYLNGVGHLKYNNNVYLAKLVLEDQLNYINYINRGNIDKIYKYIQPVDLDKFEIKILDELENEIELNGLDISLSIELKFIKNNYLKLYYENYNYDDEVSTKILQDNMLRYFYDKTRNVNFVTNDNLIENIYSNPGAKLLHILSKHTYNYTHSVNTHSVNTHSVNTHSVNLESNLENINNTHSVSNNTHNINNTQSVITQSDKFMSAEELGKKNYINSVKKEKEVKKQIKEIKNKFVY